MTHSTVGNVYIADTYNQRIRKVTVSTGIITTIAGSGTAIGNNAGSDGGDNGPATSAGLNNPKGVAVDTLGMIIASVYSLNYPADPRCMPFIHHRQRVHR